MLGLDAQIKSVREEIKKLEISKKEENDRKTEGDQIYTDLGSYSRKSEDLMDTLVKDLSRIKDTDTGCFGEYYERNMLKELKSKGMFDALNSTAEARRSIFEVLEDIQKLIDTLANKIQEAFKFLNELLQKAAELAEDIKDEFVDLFTGGD